ncbi:Aminopeptidase N [Penaeus vannamei]|uniref:Aminopeptidase N n=1 Tax=Penaeus vannamei TaxID=6689 RepID=A0A3R7LZU8_PENVA|nr:Aminopeptidase N [Penaeus vannamei]
MQSNSYAYSDKIPGWVWARLHHVHLPSPLLLLPFPRPPLPLSSSPSPSLFGPPLPLFSSRLPSPLLLSSSLLPFLSPSLSLSFSRPSFPLLLFVMDLLAPAESHWSCDMASQDSMAELTLFACRLGRHESLRLFRRWMRHPENRTSLSPNHWSEVLCTGVSAGGEKEWELVWNEYLNSNTTQERTSFLTALACSENATILSR